MITLDVKYEYIVEDLKNSSHKENVDHLFKEAGIKLPPIDQKQDSRHECAKAFLIWLAVSTFGISAKSDLVLCYMGLLYGYSSIPKVQDRRKKLIFDQHSQTLNAKESTPYQKNEADLIKKANNLYKDDKPLARIMIEYFCSLDHKEACYLEACEQYLTITRLNHNIRQVRLPNPSFSSKYDRPIRFNLRPRNPLFCGREEILQSVKENLSLVHERQAVVLYGMGGVGKTQIALEYIHLHQNEYSTILWLDASDFDTLNRKCCELLLEYSKYNNKEAFSDSEVIPILFKKFINKRASTLLILDNADFINYSDDEIQDAKERLLSYIPSMNVNVIITTRNDRAFYNFGRIQVDVFSPEQSVDFLVSKTGLEANDFAESLAERLGFLPLALDYASGYISVNQISYQEYLRLWESHGFMLFDQNQADYAEKTIRQAFDITLDKLKKSQTTPYPILLELIRTIAFFSTEYLPIKQYTDFAVAREKRSQELASKIPDIAPSSCFVFRSPDKTSEPDVHEGVFYIISSDSSHTRFYAKYRRIKPAKTDVIEILDEPVLKTLQNEIKLNEALRILSGYSLINRVNDKIIIHPMLREVIIAKTPLVDSLCWQFEEYSFEDVANVYKIAGDSKLASKYKDKHIIALKQIDDPSLPFSKRH